MVFITFILILALGLSTAALIPGLARLNRGGQSR
jgi:hypothetical protein